MWPSTAARRRSPETAVLTPSLAKIALSRRGFSTPSSRCQAAQKSLAVEAIVPGTLAHCARKALASWSPCSDVRLSLACRAAACRSLRRSLHRAASLGRSGTVFLVGAASQQQLPCGGGSKSAAEKQSAELRAALSSPARPVVEAATFRGGCAEVLLRPRLALRRWSRGEPLGDDAGSTAPLSAICEKYADVHHQVGNITYDGIRVNPTAPPRPPAAFTSDRELRLHWDVSSPDVAPSSYGS
jgi:hypothetical protein